MKVSSVPANIEEALFYIHLEGFLYKLANE